MNNVTIDGKNAILLGAKDRPPNNIVQLGVAKVGKHVCRGFVDAVEALADGADENVARCAAKK